MSRALQLLFVQGGGAHTHDECDHKLVASLQRQLGPNVQLRYPRMPNEHEPDYALWRAALQAELDALDEGAILVAHSVGATILLAMLAERQKPPRIGALLLIAAPFVGEGGWPSEDLQLPPDLGQRLPNVPIHFFHGLQDETAPPSHLDLYAAAVPHAHVHRLPGRDHQLNDDLKEVAAQIEALAAHR